MSRRVVTVGALALLFALSGCALDRRDAPAPAPAPAGIARDELLSTLAACHLLRVGQTNDVAVSDAVVIAAADRYGLTVDAIVERSNRLIQEYRALGPVLVALAVDACRSLSAETGVTSALMRFEPDGRPRMVWLRIDDVEMTEGFAERVMVELRQRRAIGLVINSPGGSVHEARKLGRWLRANGLRTAVDRVCTSACVDVLAGGVERYVTRDARLGVHQSKVPHLYSSHEGGQLYVADSARYLREMGVDAEMAIAAASVPNDKILLIPLSDALATGLVTGVVDGFQ
ncbi:hypothetical protein [Thiocystis violascens]|uniref:Periplasmic protein-like protein n=1 Tax=Thiocystis violascens (strain ATCC 17096 / DSM 198 / 6111) TaxID=765911 RepID=I3YDI7_THIV6|nr:hypothetical protein [Thiocystis violascens]AFL75055.1 hypothetical protein Thivi_3178 [Thiocystis violascens DSM 198]